MCLRKAVVAVVLAAMLSALLPTGVLAQTLPAAEAEQNSGSQLPTPDPAEPVQGVGGLPAGPGLPPADGTGQPGGQDDDTGQFDAGDGLADDDLLTWRDGDRDISMRVLGPAEADSLVAAAFGESVEGLAAAAAGAFDSARASAGGNGSESGEVAAPTTWLQSDTGELHLLVGGVVVEFVPQASPSQIEALLRRLGVPTGRLTAHSQLPSTYLVSTATDGESLELASALSAEQIVASARPDTYQPVALGPPEPAGVTFETTCVPGGRPWSDRLSNCLWHLDSDTSFRYGFHDPVIDINIDNVWETTKGEGVAAVVIDTAINQRHPDLVANVAGAKSYQISNSRKNHEHQFHGTAVAGILGARDNDIGGRGVAPRVTLIDYPLLNVHSAWRESQAMTWRKAEAAVYNMSWGAPASPGLSREYTHWSGSIDEGLANGFGGKGSSYVVSAGNGRGTAGDAPESGWTTLQEQTNHIGVIPVCAVASDGIAAVYSERGPSLWVCAPSRDSWRSRPGLLTTDYVGDYRAFGGTSAAAPAVSGVIALMRSANSDLTWRDVKLILAQTAQQVDAADASWELAGTHYGPSGGRYSFSNTYGFGLVDAKAAVEAALSWPLLPALKTWEGSGGFGHGGSMQDLPSSGDKIDVTFDVSSDIEFVEYVNLDLNISTLDVRDYRITLTSPSGTTSLLAPEAVDARCAYRSCGISGTFTYGSSRHLGEDPSGTWTLTIDNKASGTACTANNGNSYLNSQPTCSTSGQKLVSWSATVHGHSQSDWVTLSASPERVSEGGTVTLTASVTGAAPTQSLVLPVLLEAGTATAPGSAGADYAALSPASITIPAGSQSGTATVTTLTDSTLEPDETFTASLGQLPSGYRASLQPAEITIAGVPPKVSIAAGADVTEGTAASFTLTAANPAPAGELSVSVVVSVQGDFGVTAGTRTVTVPPSGTATFTIPTTGDDVDEVDGSATVTVQAGTGYAVSSPSAATVNISDDDVDLPKVAITPGAGVVEGTAASFSLSASPAPTAPLTVEVSIAAAGSFGVTTGSKTVTVPTSGTVSFTVPTTGDEVDEADGSVTATVQSGSGYTVGSPSLVSVSVADDDDPPLPAVSVLPGDRRSLLSALQRSDVTEGTDAKFTLTAVPKPKTSMTVKVNVTASGDYGVTTGVRNVTVPTSGTAVFTVPTAGDEVDEADGSVTATVQSGTGYEVGSPSVGTVKVADDDGPPPAAVPEITISAGAGVTEGTAASFTLSASPAPASALSVSVDVTATGSFGVTIQSLSLPVPTSGSVSFSVPTVGDRVDEADGSVTATVQSGSGYTVGSASAATVAVADDDVPEVTISAGAGVTEGTAASFTLSASPAPASALSVSVSVAAAGSFGVTTGGRDVTVPTSGSVAFTVPTVGDGVDEADGWVTATVQSGSGYTVGSASAGTVAVADDDVPEVTIKPVGSGLLNQLITLTEGSSVSFTVSASPVPASPLAVNIGVSETGDFGASGPATVTLSGASATYTVTTSDDEVDEPNGSVTATVQSGSGYTVGSPSAATANVADDDDPTVLPAGHPRVRYAALIEWIRTDRVADHSDDSAHVQWKRVLKALGDPDYADYSESAMTSAQARTRYENSPWRSSWTGWDSSWDEIWEAIAYAESYSPTDPPPAADPEITITAGAGVTEGTAASFTLSADPAPAAALTVQVNVTAVGDFGAATGVRNVTVPTSGSVSFTVPTTGDEVDEPNGSVTATVQSGSGYTVGSASAGTVSVADDDDPPPAPAAPVVKYAAMIEWIRTDRVADHSDDSAHVQWKRVLKALGDPDYADYSESAMTSAQARTRYENSPWRSSWTGWDSSWDEIWEAIAYAESYSPTDPPPVVVPQVTIAAGAGVIEDTAASFTLTASPVPAAPLTVAVAVTAAGDYGVTTGSRQVTVPTTGTVTFTVPTVGDGVDEPDGSVTVTVQSGSGYTVGSAASGTVAVADDDDPPPVVVPQVTIAAGAGVIEDTAASFTLTASPAPQAALSVRVNVTAAGSFGVTTGVRDVTVPTTGTVTFTVPTAGDQADEPDGSVTVTVQSGAGYTVGAASAGTVSVADDDDPPPVVVPQVTIAAGSGVTEGTAASFTLTASPAPAAALTVKVSVTASGGFGVSTGVRSVTVPTSGTAAFTVPTVGDQADEADGSVTATVQSGTGYTVGGAASGTVSVADDDDAPADNSGTLTVAAGVQQSPSVSVGRPRVPLRFAVTASETALQDVTVSYTFAARGVSPYLDYCLAPAGTSAVGFRCASLPYDPAQPTGTVTIVKGASTAEIAVAIDPHAWIRGNAQIDLILTAVTGAKAITAKVATGSVRR